MTKKRRNSKVEILDDYKKFLTTCN